MTLAGDLRIRLTASAADSVPYAGDLRRTDDAAQGVAAAVLIAITDRPAPGLILTQRPDTMRAHAGQVAFPGGRVDPGDADAIAAALREAEEEVALPPSAVTVIGTLAPYRTITGYDIVPVLGVVAPDLPLVPHDAEVSAVFEVPLAFVFDRARHVERRIDLQGDERRFIEMHWDDGAARRHIWGATAAMLVNLAVRLGW